MRAWPRTFGRTHEIATTRDNPEFIPMPAGMDKLLLEDSSFILLETSDKVLLE